MRLLMLSAIAASILYSLTEEEDPLEAWLFDLDFEHGFDPILIEVFH
jgi:hypothetical protein